MRVLLVEDEPDLANALAAALRRHCMAVDVAGSLRAAEDAALDAAYDVILLDRSLPDGDGLALLDLLVHTGAETAPRAAVVMLSTMGGIADRVAGLDRGADDYLSKPFALDELLARMRAVVRRPGARKPRTLQLGRLRFDTDMRHVFVNTTPLMLPRRELLALEALLLNKQCTVPRSTLLERVYEEGRGPKSNSLDANLSRLRSRLDSADAGVEIHAIRGVGYLLREVLPC